MKTFFFVSGPWAIKYRPFIQKIREGCQNCVLRVQKDLWRENVLSSENYFIEHLLALHKNFWLHDKNFWQRCQICIVSVYRISFRRNLYSDTLFFFFHFWTLSWRIWVFCLKMSARLSKLRSTGSKRSCEKKSFRRRSFSSRILSGTEKKLWLLGKKFWQCSQNCILSVHTIILRKIIYSEFF